MKEMIKGKFEDMKVMHFVEKVHLLNKMKEEFGDKVYDVVEENLKEDVTKQWSEIADQHSKNDIDELLNVLWEHFCKSGGFEYTVERKEDGVQIICTKCPLADMAREIGEADWGYKFYCASDPYIVEAFNNKIGFTRTKTLMEGHEYCNHFYYYK